MSNLEQPQQLFKTITITLLYYTVLIIIMWPNDSDRDILSSCYFSTDCSGYVGNRVVLLCQWGLLARADPGPPNSFTPCDVIRVTREHMAELVIIKTPLHFIMDSWFSSACLENRRSRIRAPLWPSSFKGTKCFSPLHSWKFNIVGSLRHREVACSA